MPTDTFCYNPKNIVQQQPNKMPHSQKKKNETQTP